MRSRIKKNLLYGDISTYVMLLSIIVIAVIFGWITDGIFFSTRNMSMLARQTTIVGVLAIGMMFVIVIGHIDLSVGSLLGLCGTIAAVLQVWYKWETIPTIIAVLSVGAICGFWQGWWVAYRNVPSFIVTLGGLLIFRGIKLGLSKSISIAPMNSDYKILGQGYLTAALGWILTLVIVVVLIFATLYKRNSKIRYNFTVKPLSIDLLKIALISSIIVFGAYILNSYQGIPIPVVILLFIAVIFSFIGNKSVFGRSVYAIGGNIEASYLAGIKIKKITLLIFILASLLASLSGIILTARLDAATASIGDSMELDAIAACVIGGASMSGGIGTVHGVIIGAFVMASLDNGMSLINLENYWQFIVKGLVLIFAVWVDNLSRKK